MFKQVQELTQLSAYDLSCKIFVAGLSHDRTAYDKLLPILNNKLIAENNPYKAAWLWGRVLLTADSFNDHLTVDIALQYMEKVLSSLDIPEQSHCFAAWAFGYLAALSSHYQQYRPLMLQANQKLLALQAAGSASQSDVLWSTVMNLQSACLAHDAKTSQQIIDSILAAYQQANLAGALHIIPADDYRAWALSIVVTALKASQLHSHELQALEEELQQSLSHATGADLDLARATLGQAPTNQPKP